MSGSVEPEQQTAGGGGLLERIRRSDPDVVATWLVYEDPAAVAMLMRLLDPGEAAPHLRALFRLNPSVVEDLVHAWKATPDEAGVDDLLTAALGDDAASVLERTSPPSPDVVSEPFWWAWLLPVEAVAAAVRTLRPRELAAFAASLPTRTPIIEQLDAGVAAEAAAILYQGGVISQAVVRRAERRLQMVLLAGAREGIRLKGGGKTAGGMIHRLGYPADGVRAELEARHPGTAEAVAPYALCFDDIARLDDLSVQRLLRAVSHRDLVLALQGRSDEVLERVMSNLSPRARETLHEEIDSYMATERSYRAAEGRIVDTLVLLAETDEILFRRRS
ncbi:MAG: FliG C-terminal domain-containing protein [Chloroflexota bacterium]